MDETPAEHQETVEKTEEMRATVEEVDRNARAYGWEVGRGRIPLAVDHFEASPDNPFLDPDWRERLWTR